MTKAGIVKQITTNTGINKDEVLQTVEEFMEIVKESLSKNENVYLRGFGSFIVKRKAEKVARNITKNTAIVLPAHNVPAFRPSKVFVEAIHTKSEGK